MVSRKIKAVVGVAGVVFLSKILGLGREVVIADKFGTSAEYDLYLIAIILPALAYGVINFASFYLFVPYLTRKLESLRAGEEVSGWRAAWSVCNFSLVSGLIITLVIIVTAPYLMKIWAGDYAAADFARVVFYSRITAAMVVLGTSEAFLRAVLNVRRIFTYPAAGPIIFNLVSIISVLSLAGRFSVGAVAIGLLAGLTLQNLYLVVRLLGMRAFGIWRPDWWTPDVKAVVGTAGILLMVELLNRSYFMIDRYFALTFGEGIISGLYYAQVLVLLPDAVVGFAIASVVFPEFSQRYSDEDRRVFSATYRNAVTAGMLVAVPMAVFVFANARDIVYLLFVRGVFDAQSLEITTNVLLPFVPTIVALFVVSTSIRACYGRGWSGTVLVFTVVLLVVKAAGTALLPKWLGYPGIAAATSVSQVGFALALLVLIVRRSKMIGGGRMALDLAKLLAAGGLGLVALYFLGDTIGSLWGLPVVSRAGALARMATSAALLFAYYAAAVQLMGFGGYVRQVVRKRSD